VSVCSVSILETCAGGVHKTLVQCRLAGGSSAVRQWLRDVRP